MRLITRATSVAFLPRIWLSKLAGKDYAALSPDKNPFDRGSLVGVRDNANSRFFTNCYRSPDAYGPPKFQIRLRRFQSRSAEAQAGI
jgi:hypothetical protein